MRSSLRFSAFSIGLPILLFAISAVAAPAATKDSRVRFGGVLKKERMATHQGQVRSMESIILTWSGSHYHAEQPGDTPGWSLKPSPSTKMQMTQVRGQDFEHETSTNGHPVFKVSNLPKNGIARLEGLIPVSGHVRVNDGGKYLSKNETSQLFAKTNKYNLVITHPDGKREMIDGVSSTGLVTGVALAVKLQKGATKVQFYPQGSAGISGYGNGRTIELQYDGE